MQQSLQAIKTKALVVLAAWRMGRYGGKKGTERCWPRALVLWRCLVQKPVYPRATGQGRCLIAVHRRQQTCQRIPIVHGGRGAAQLFNARDKVAHDFFAVVHHRAIAALPAIQNMDGYRRQRRASRRQLGLKKCRTRLIRRASIHLLVQIGNQLFIRQLAKALLKLG